MIKIKKFIQLFNLSNKYTFIIALFLFMNCGFFITFANEGSILAGLSPQYLGFYFALIYTPILILITKKLHFPISSGIGLITVLYIICAQLFFTNGRTIAVLGSVVSVMFYILGTILLPRLNYKQVKFAADAAIVYSLILFAFDTIYKLIHYGFNVVYMFFHYRVKFSLLYPDSNTLGIQITFLFVLAYYLYKQTKQKWYLFVIFAYLLAAFCTFSRAAVIAILLMVGYEIFASSIKTAIGKYRQKYLSLKQFLSVFIIVITLLIGGYLTLEIITYLLSDFSFGTKLDLFKDTINFIKTAPLKDLFCGIGFNNGRIYEYCDRYAHSYLTTYIVEAGLFGYILFTTFLFRIFLECKNTIYVFVPFFVFGFSYFGHTHLHVFYSVLAIIRYFELYGKENCISEK